MFEPSLLLMLLTLLMLLARLWVCMVGEEAPCLLETELLPEAVERWALWKL